MQNSFVRPPKPYPIFLQFLTRRPLRRSSDLGLWSRLNGFCSTLTDLSRTSLLNLGLKTCPTSLTFSKKTRTYRHLFSEIRREFPKKGNNHNKSGNVLINSAFFSSHLCLDPKS